MADTEAFDIVRKTEARGYFFQHLVYLVAGAAKQVGYPLTVQVLVKIKFLAFNELSERSLCLTFTRRGFVKIPLCDDRDLALNGTEALFQRLVLFAMLARLFSR